MHLTYMYLLIAHVLEVLYSARGWKNIEERASKDACKGPTS